MTARLGCASGIAVALAAGAREAPAKRPLPRCANECTAPWPYNLRRVSTMAIDYGGKRIGVAISESDILATPHAVLRNEGDVVAELAKIADEIEASRIVVGIAKRARTEAGEEKFHKLAEALRQRTCKEVVLWDEALSTVEAAERLRAAGKSARETKELIDMHAAAVILQSYLDAHAGRPS